MGRHRLEPGEAVHFHEELQQAPAPDPLPFGVNMVGRSSLRSAVKPEAALSARIAI